MTEFNCNDFLSDNLPKGGMYNSKLIRAMVENNPDFKGDVLNIFLTAKVWNNELLYQWMVIVSICGKEMTLILPVYVPENPRDAGLCLQKHQDAVDEKLFVYSHGDYLIWNNKYPCQVHIDENGDVFIKKIELWASQKMVQGFLSLILEVDVYSTLIFTMSQIGQSEKYYDIGWFVCTNEKEIFMPLTSVIYTFEKCASLIERKDIDVGTTFVLNLQKYIVAEDQENGLYLCKIN